MRTKNRLAGLVAVARNTDRYASLVNTEGSVSLAKASAIISASVRKQPFKGASISARESSENMVKSYGL